MTTAQGPVNGIKIIWELMRATILVVVGAGAHVDGHGVGAEPDLPATAGGPVLPIGLLGIHEEPFVESAHVDQRFAPDQKNRAYEIFSRSFEAAQPDRLQPGFSRSGEGPAHPVRHG